MRNIILFICISCLISCDKVDQTKAKKVELVLQDSIVVDYIGNLYIVTQNELDHHYLSLDRTTGNIVEFDNKGNISMVFNPSEPGPNAIKGELIGLNYFQDSLLLIQSRDSYYVLNKEGEIMSTYTPGRSGALSGNMRYRLQADGPFIFSNRGYDTEYKLNEVQFYEEAKNLAVIDFREDTSLNYHIPYEDNSLYKEVDKFYMNTFPIFNYNPADSLIYLLHAMDRKVRVYDPYQEFKLVHEIKTSPQNFKEPSGTPFGQQINTLKELTYGSYYLNFFNDQDLMVLEYTTGLPLTINQPGSVAELNELMVDNNKFYYEVFLKGKKLGEAELPKNKMGLRIVRDNKAIFQLDKNKEERDYEVFYEYTFVY